MPVTIPITTAEEKKLAAVGVVLSVLGLIVFGWGTHILNDAGRGQPTGGIMMVIFGILLALYSIFFFIIPAIFALMEEWHPSGAETIPASEE